MKKNKELKHKMWDMFNIHVPKKKEKGNNTKQVEMMMKWAGV